MINSDVEFGKAAIIEHVKELMLRHKLDVDPLVFSWHYEAMYSRWILRVFRGAAINTLRFLARDVQAWATSSDVAGRYEAGMLDVIDKMVKGSVGA